MTTNYKKILTGILGIGSFVLAKIVWQWKKSGKISKISAVFLMFALFVFGTLNLFVTAPDKFSFAAEGDYISSFDTSAAGAGAPAGLATNSTYIWVLDDSDNEVYKYNMSGTYQSKWGLNVNNDHPKHITTDGNYFWVSDSGNDEVYKYNMSGTYQSSWDTSSEVWVVGGIATDGTNIWLIDEMFNTVFKYNMSGTYQSETWGLTAANTDPAGMTTNGTYIWVTDGSDDEVYKYNMSGTYQSSWDTSGQTLILSGITTNTTNYWVSCTFEDDVFKYEGVLASRRIIITE